MTEPSMQAVRFHACGLPEVLRIEEVPRVGPVPALDEAAQAHARSEIGHGRGRIVLHVAD